MTGTTWIEESSFLEGPVMLTNTHSVGIVRDAVVDWIVGQRQNDPAITLSTFTLHSSRFMPTWPTDFGCRCASPFPLKPTLPLTW